VTTGVPNEIDNLSITPNVRQAPNIIALYEQDSSLPKFLVLMMANTLTVTATYKNPQIAHVYVILLRRAVQKIHTNDHHGKTGSPLMVITATPTGIKLQWTATFSDHNPKAGTDSQIIQVDAVDANGNVIESVAVPARNFP
jgi:hypothetical protein